MTVITDFLLRENLTVDELIEQLTAIRNEHGNMPVVVPVEIENSFTGEESYALGQPLAVNFNSEDRVVEIGLKNYFEV